MVGRSECLVGDGHVLLVRGTGRVGWTGRGLRAERGESRLLFGWMTYGGSGVSFVTK